MFKQLIAEVLNRGVTVSESMVNSLRGSLKKYCRQHMEQIFVVAAELQKAGTYVADSGYFDSNLIGTTIPAWFAYGISFFHFATF